MKQNASLLLIIGGLFALWLYNTGRVAAFKQYVLDVPGQPTLPRAGSNGQKTASAGSSGPDAQKVASCGAQASEGIVTADCLNVFAQAISRPGDVIGSAVKTLTFGIVKL